RDRSGDTACAVPPGQDAGIDYRPVVLVLAYHHVVAVRERLRSPFSAATRGVGGSGTVAGRDGPGQTGGGGPPGDCTHVGERGVPEPAADDVVAIGERGHPADADLIAGRGADQTVGGRNRAGHAARAAPPGHRTHVGDHAVVPRL